MDTVKETQGRRDGIINTMDLAPYEEQLADDSLCTHCGECCHFGVDLGGEAIATIHDIPCVHLRRDRETGTFRCRIYADRLTDDVAPWCRSATECVREGLFPPTCPYVQGIEGYRGRITFERDVQRKLLGPLLAGERPQGADPMSWEIARARQRISRKRDATERRIDRIGQI